MSAFRAVILKCDFAGCRRQRTVKVTTTAGGVHQAREKVLAFGWSYSDELGDRCQDHQ